MVNIEQARRLIDSEPDVADLLREFAEVDRYYREVIAAMSLQEAEIPSVLNSAEVTVSFQPAPVLLDMSER